MQIFRKLPVLNILRRKGRSAAMILIAALLSFAVFAGMLVTAGLRSGLESLEDRLGADILVIPEEAAGKGELESILLQGSSGYFYMEDTKLDEVAEVEGIGQISGQLFLASLAAGCCSAKVQLMGYDPETDFAVRPWIRRSYGKELHEMEVVVGSDIVSDEGDRLLFYEVPCTVVGKLLKTGTNYDRCVFAGEDTIRVITQSSVGKKLNQFRDVDPEHVISCILVNAQEGYDIGRLAEAINTEVDGVTAVRTKDMISGMADSLSGISGIVRVLMIVICALAFVILAAAFTMMVHERRREFAVLRAIGVSRRQLSRSVRTEILLISLAGGLLGCAAGACAAILFSGVLQSETNLPLLLPGAGTVLLFMASAVLAAAAACLLGPAAAVNRTTRTDPGAALREER